MNISSLFPSKWLRASDCEDKPLVLRIFGVETETMRDGTEKGVVYFRETKKGLILNRINADSIVELYGPNTDDWLGKTIQLIASTTEYAGKTVPAIRVRPPVKSKQQPPTAENFDDLDDEIPW